MGGFPGACAGGRAAGKGFQAGYFLRGEGYQVQHTPPKGLACFSRRFTLKLNVHMGVNKKYKDSLFSWLFSDPDTLRELYGAIEGVRVDPALPITINTLEGVLFMERMNDISFEIGGKLVVLIEHQSTINPNMALRLLMYVARVYEKIIGSENIYSETKLLIPQPEFAD
jgi:hypothetical protein